jgi:hypothetical protein
VPLLLKPTRQFSFIPVRNKSLHCCWGCGVVGNAQRYPSALWSLRSSVHQVRQIHSPKR